MQNPAAIWISASIKGAFTGCLPSAACTPDLEESFGLPVDLLTTDSLDDNFRREIASEEVPIYGNGYNIEMDHRRLE